jgi:aspartyl-tRNA(Asn)/glutamyl-tRNA(Gln) amidotransferase subunit C
MSQQRISLDDVRHVAKLSRLALNDQQLQKLSGQLLPILQYVAKIGQADVNGVEPMAHAVPLANVLREDVAQPALPLDAVLQNAPASDGPFFKVPKVIGGDEDSAG